jgi:hypothetical protein
MSNWAITNFANQQNAQTPRARPKRKLAQTQGCVKGICNDFTIDIDSSDAIASMTDCDNAQLPMTEFYKDIHFTPE